MLTLTTLNGDTTFVLTFTTPTSTFTLLLDPWLSGPAPYLHPLFSTQSHLHPPPSTAAPLVSAVLLSQAAADHTHEPTLRALPGAPTIFAVPAAARVVRNYSWLDASRVVELIPGQAVALGEGGEATLLSPRWPWELPSIHSAVGIRGPDGTRVLFSPHGSPAGTVEGWKEEGVEVLLWPWDTVRMPWWLGGRVSLGAEVGAGVAARLKAGTWVSAHDGEKVVGGFVNKWLRRMVWTEEEVREMVGGGTEVVRVAVGEKVVVGVEKEDRDKELKVEDGDKDLRGEMEGHAVVTVV
jgi:L-ascorbate metabolism protein UlaG (beta-lactamase superfamily)